MGCLEKKGRSGRQVVQTGCREEGVVALLAMREEFGRGLCVVWDGFWHCVLIDRCTNELRDVGVDASVSLRNVDCVLLKKQVD